MTRGVVAFSGPAMRGATVYTMASEQHGGALVTVIVECGHHCAFETFVAPTRREAWASMAAWVEAQLAAWNGVSA